MSYNIVQPYYLQIWMSDVDSVLRDNWVIVVAISPDTKELQLAKIFILKRQALSPLSGYKQCQYWDASEDTSGKMRVSLEQARWVLSEYRQFDKWWIPH